MEIGHNIWYVECKEPVEDRVSYAVARELVRYKSDLVGVQKVRLDKEVTVREGDYIFSMKKAKKIINWE
jgi:hypothetical protein